MLKRCEQGRGCGVNNGQDGLRPSCFLDVKRGSPGCFLDILNKRGPRLFLLSCNKRGHWKKKDVQVLTLGLHVLWNGGPQGCNASPPVPIHIL
jgi:hypothetical protein